MTPWNVESRRANMAVSRAGVTQLAECLLPKQNVAGSNPVSRSTFPSGRCCWGCQTRARGVATQAQPPPKKTLSDMISNKETSIRQLPEARRVSRRDGDPPAKTPAGYDDLLQFDFAHDDG